MTTNLLPEDVLQSVRRLPEPVRELLKAHRLVLAGGWVRASIAGERPSDIDLFGPDEATLKAAEEALAEDVRVRRYESDFAVTLSWGPWRAQFIRAWTFKDAEAVIAAFDFTVARAAIWWTAGGFTSVADERFYVDLAAKRLVFGHPKRGENYKARESGGSMLRALKFVRRGYRIPVKELANVIGEFVGHFEDPTPEAMAGSLRMADPLPPELDFEDIFMASQGEEAPDA